MITKLTAAITALLIVAVSARAQNVEAGKAIAERWCSGCHIVDRTQNKVPNDAIPSFLAVANMASTTHTSLAVFLQTSHEPMPNFMLSRSEIADVSAYILRLKKAPAGPR